MATMSIDELNSFEPEKYIEDYFKPMPISEDRKEERRDAAKDFRDILLLILALIAIEYEKNLLDWAYIQEQFRKELLSASLKYAAESEAIQDYVNTKSNDFIDTTKEQDLSDPYWTSDMRATHEAVNEANDVISISEMQRAEALGAVQKRWKTERDTKVRPTHRAVDGAVENIDDMFRVGKDLMRFPHDWYYSAKESYNCRCGLDYLDENGKVVLVGKMREEVNKTYDKVQLNNSINHGNIISSIKAILGNNKGSVPLSQTAREKHYDLYHESWGEASFSDIKRKYAPNAVGVPSGTGKTLYVGPNFTLIYDDKCNYFRIADNSLYGKRKYVRLDGTNPTNITENGKTRGRTKWEYEPLTHFRDSDKHG